MSKTSELTSRRQRSRRWCITILALFPALAAAQSPATELWPELDVYWRQAAHQRTFLKQDQAEREGPHHQATVGLYQDYLNLPSAYLRLGYRYTFSTRDGSYRESRIVAEGVGSSGLWSRLRGTSRTRFEGRWINGDPSYRVRERVQVQWESKDKSCPRWAPYASVEPYYDSRYRTIARMQERIGTDVELSRHVAAELYFARQDDSRGQPAAVNAIGVTLKLKY